MLSLEAVNGSASKVPELLQSLLREFEHLQQHYDTMAEQNNLLREMMGTTVDFDTGEQGLIDGFELLSRSGKPQTTSTDEIYGAEAKALAKSEIVENQPISRDQRPQSPDPGADNNEKLETEAAAKPKLRRDESLKMRADATTKRVERIFEVNKKLEDKRKNQKAMKARDRERNILARISTLDAKEKETDIDAFMGVVIMANAFVIGLSLDNGPSTGMNGWQVVDIMFTCIFMVEIVLKLKIHGFRIHFFR